MTLILHRESTALESCALTPQRVYRTVAQIPFRDFTGLKSCDFIFIRESMELESCDFTLFKDSEELQGCGTHSDHKV